MQHSAWHSFPALISYTVSRNLTIFSPRKLILFYQPGCVVISPKYARRQSMSDKSPENPGRHRQPHIANSVTRVVIQHAARQLESGGLLGWTLLDFEQEPSPSTTRTPPMPVPPLPP